MNDRSISLLAFFIVSLCIPACEERPAAESAGLCTDAWYRSVEERVSIADADQHGPDLGSDEWKSAVEFKLGVRGQRDVPDRGTEAWCSYIDQLVRKRSPTRKDSPD